MVAPADLPRVRQGLLLRQLTEPARLQARCSGGPPADPLARAGRGVVLLLRRPGRHAHPGSTGRDPATAVADGRLTTAMAFVSRGFGGKRRVPEELEGRVPPGQYVEPGFPVLTAGPTPDIDPTGGEWSFRVDGMVAEECEWSWEEFGELPSEEVPCDIHCVTKWSKLGTSFRGGVGRHAARGGGAARGVRDGLLIRRVYDQPCDRGPDRRQGVGRHRAEGEPRRANTAGRRACSSLTSTSGRAPSGSPGCG